MNRTNNKLYKMNIITAAMIVAVLFVSIMLTIFNYTKSDFNVYDNSARMLVAEQKNDIENGVFRKGKYPYMIFSLAGRVMYSSIPFEQKVGDVVNVQEMLQFDKSFYKQKHHDVKVSFVLEKKGVTNGFVVFLMPRNDIMQNTITNQMWRIFLPVIIGLIICVIILLLRTIYCNHRILSPLKEISTSANGIVAGNYDLEVLRVYGNRINENEVGELTFAFESMRDELKAKQVKEEALKKSQQELISCISHDLKTPISTIKAYSEGLRDHIAKNTETQAQFVKIIIDKTNLLTDMINELLEYSNAQLNQLDIYRTEVYFLDYFNPLMREIEIFVKQNDMDFYYEENSPNMIVNIDTKRITEVMYNLIENSIKYKSEKKGKIVVRAEYDENCIVVRVKDNGIGIGPDDIPYVFDRFYRAEKSRSTSIPGSGLGLSICKYVINEHGGEIYCKSGHNQGCEIWFTL